MNITKQEPMLILPNKLRHNDAIIDDFPKHLYPQVMHSPHSIRFPEHKFFILIHIESFILYFDIRQPNHNNLYEHHPYVVVTIF